MNIIVLRKRIQHISITKNDVATDPVSSRDFTKHLKVIA